MLSQRATSALREHRWRQVEERLAFDGEWLMPELVFSNQWDGPLDGGWMTTRYKGILADAGLPVIRFHDLRHTAATLLLEQGTYPKVVSDMLGHATISLTLDTYSHVIPTLHEEAARTMDRLFGS
jgi:integrase